MSVPSTYLEVSGIVLAGGQARRMGGGDKGMLELAGKSVLQHIVERFKPQAGRLALNANGDPQRFAAYGLDVFPDTVCDRPGPLAGILAGMLWAERNTPAARWIATVPSDTPLLPHNLIAKLLAACAANRAAAAIARSNGHLHPVVGLWHVGCRRNIAAALECGVRKMRHWADRCGAVAVDFPSIEIAGRNVDPFFNINTPQELAEARALLAAGVPSL